MSSSPHEPGQSSRQGSQTSGEAMEIGKENGILEGTYCNPSGQRLSQLLEHLEGLKLQKSQGCANTKSNNSDFFNIFTSILHDITEFQTDLHIENEFLEKKIFPLMCNFIEGLSEQEFNEVQKEIITFLIEDWPKTYCLLTIGLIADIFGFITQIADHTIVEEYLNIFSNTTLPPQFRYFIFPVIFKHSGIIIKEKEAQQNDINLILQYETIMSKMSKKESLPDDVKFIKLFWSQISRTNCGSIIDKLVPFCVATAIQIKSFELELLMLVLSVVNQFLQQPAKKNSSVLGACTILLGLQQKFFEKSSLAWNEILKICKSLISLTQTYNRGMISTQVCCFSVKCVCTFMNQVNVESEEMIQDLKANIQDFNLDNLETTDTRIPGGDLQEKSSRSQKKEPKSVSYVPMFEKFVNILVSRNVDLSADDLKRITQAMNTLNNFILSKQKHS